MKRRMCVMGRRCLVWMVLVGMVLGAAGPVSAGWYQTPDYMKPSEDLSYPEDAEMDPQQERYTTPLFYMPDVYQTHRITGYGAVALTILAVASGDDSTLHKVSGASAALCGVAAGTSGHMAYGGGINFREGWTRENIHAGAGYLATAALVLAAGLGAADEDHKTVGGIATAAAVVPVAVFVF
ncbi:hypothetical protein [Desulfoluna spongiiphila]|nr:hypothetical protein [Desulfoluna spongiiphila]